MFLLIRPGEVLLASLGLLSENVTQRDGLSIHVVWGYQIKKNMKTSL